MSFALVRNSETGKFKIVDTEDLDGRTLGSTVEVLYDDPDIFGEFIVVDSLLIDIGTKEAMRIKLSEVKNMGLEELEELLAKKRTRKSTVRTLNTTYNL